MTGARLTNAHHWKNVGITLKLYMIHKLTLTSKEKGEEMTFYISELLLFFHLHNKLSKLTIGTRHLYILNSPWLRLRLEISDEFYRTDSNCFMTCRIWNCTPLTGAPSINSNFARVSVSTYVLGPDPVDSLRLISSSIFLILILTKRKYILPMMTSFRWYLQNFEVQLVNNLLFLSVEKIKTNHHIIVILISTYLLLPYSNSMCRQSSIPTSICTKHP